MPRITLIADRTRSDFAELRNLAMKLSAKLGERTIEIASQDDEIEHLAGLNISRVPVLAVDGGKTLILLNRHSQSLDEVVRRSVS